MYGSRLKYQDADLIMIMVWCYLLSNWRGRPLWVSPFKIMEFCALFLLNDALASIGRTPTNHRLAGRRVNTFSFGKTRAPWQQRNRRCLQRPRVSLRAAVDEDGRVLERAAFC